MAPRKVVLLGDYGVGKTSFGLRLAKDEFKETTMATLGVAHFKCRVATSVLASAVELEVWDTAGQERYRSLDVLRLYLRRAVGAVVVVDVTVGGSFEAAKHLISQLRGDEDCAAHPDLAIAIALNKCDLVKRDVSEAAIAEFASAQRCSWLYTSCKTGEGVQDLAKALVGALPADEEAAPSSGAVGLTMPGAESSLLAPDCC